MGETDIDMVHDTATSMPPGLQLRPLADVERGGYDRIYAVGVVLGANRVPDTLSVASNRGAGWGCMANPLSHLPMHAHRDHTFRAACCRQREVAHRPRRLRYLVVCLDTSLEP